jgi:DnaK suppressor protein
MKKSLSQREVEIYRQRLLRMRLATAAAVQSVEERSLQSTQGTRSEIGDGAAEETVMDLELEGLAIQRELDRSTERALDRVEEGLYGVCATCGADIGRERLDLLPYAIDCVQCARRMDSRQN